MTGQKPPLIGISACVRDLNGHSLHGATERYIIAAAEAAGGLPLIVPALGPRIDVAELAGRLDGLVLTGSRSNVEPHHYDGAPSRPGTAHDAARDATTLPLIRAALAADLPLLAICRGFEELNVALGGTLHQHVHETPGRIDHRAVPDAPVNIRFAHRAHPVRLAEGGLFRRLAGGAPEIIVNSLHEQGIDRLADRLRVEAVGPDGQIEGVQATGARFAVGVQWHPEHAVDETPFSRALFAAFGEACRARAAAARRSPAAA